ncbi:MAG: alpha/beta hydrolase [Alphaproteobacteria bacterium]
MASLTATKLRVWILSAAAILVIAALARGPIVRAYEASQFATDVVSGLSVTKNGAELPIRMPITYEIDGRKYAGDIYVPRGRAPRAAAVAVPGVVAEGKDDPRLVAFATSLARAGFLVLTPDIPNIRALKIGSSDADFVAAATRYLASRAESGQPQSVGLFAFSYAAGPAIIAAMKPEAHHLVRFVFAVGAYYNIEAAVTFLTTGYYRNETGTWTLGHPSPYAKWVFLISNAARIENADDRKTVEAIADRKRANEEADIGDLVPKLGVEGRAIYALMLNKDPERVPKLIAALSAPVRQEMSALDLRNQDLQSLDARLILIHGVDDTLVPYTESIALARAAASDAHLLIIGSLGHVEPRLSNFPDILKFWQAAYEILAERDAMPEPAKAWAADAR